MKIEFHKVLFLAGILLLPFACRKETKEEPPKTRITVCDIDTRNRLPGVRVLFQNICGYLYTGLRDTQTTDNNGECFTTVKNISAIHLRKDGYVQSCIESPGSIIYIQAQATLRLHLKNNAPLLNDEISIEYYPDLWLLPETRYFTSVADTTILCPIDPKAGNFKWNANNLGPHQVNYTAIGHQVIDFEISY